MNVKFTKQQSEWIINVTGEKTLQSAVDMFVRIMREEGISATEIINVVNKIMQRSLPPGTK
jgi:hypothetical protein